MKVLRQLAVLTVLGIFASTAFAEDAARARLASEVRRVERRRDPRSPFSFDSSPSSAADFQFQTAEDIIQDNRARDQFVSMYRSVYTFQQFNNLLGVREFEDFESRSVAEKLLAYQATVTVGRMLSESPIGARYERMLQRLKYLKSYTGMGVRRSNSGYAVNRQADKDDNFLDLRLHLSVRDGIQPRLSIAHNLNLRYDAFSKSTLLEYQVEF